MININNIKSAYKFKFNNNYLNDDDLANPTGRILLPPDLVHEGGYCQ